MDAFPQANYSRTEYMVQLKPLLLIAVFSITSPTLEAKKRCKPLLAKLQNIQAMQRHGYSAKQGLSLRSREDKARKNWWQCENGSGKKKKKTTKKSQRKTASYSTEKSSVNRKIIKAGTPFKTSNTIVIKSKYQGEKKRAWLAFYQQPTRCQRPKNLSVFAFCSENKQTQRAGFEQKYRHESK